MIRIDIIIFLFNLENKIWIIKYKRFKSSEVELVWLTITSSISTSTISTWKIDKNRSLKFIFSSLLEQRLESTSIQFNLPPPHPPRWADSAGSRFSFSMSSSFATDSRTERIGDAFNPDPDSFIFSGTFSNVDGFGWGIISCS